MLDNNNCISFNGVETIAIVVCKQITSNSFKNEITDKLISHTSLYQFKMCADRWLMINCYCYIAIFESIYLCANKWLIVEIITRIR